MKHLFLPFMALVMATLAGCSTTAPPEDFSRTPPLAVTIQITCSKTDMRFDGKIVSDGQPLELTGTGGGTYRTTGHIVTCSFKKLGEDGNIALNVSDSGAHHGAADNSKEFGGVRAEIVHTAHEEHYLYTTF